MLQGRKVCGAGAADMAAGGGKVAPFFRTCLVISEKTRLVHAVDIFCAETTPKAARPMDRTPFRPDR